jgi:hypothetical protein
LVELEPDFKVSKLFERTRRKHEKKFTTSWPNRPLVSSTFHEVIRLIGLKLQVSVNFMKEEGRGREEREEERKSGRKEERREEERKKREERGRKAYVSTPLRGEYIFIHALPCFAQLALLHVLSCCQGVAFALSLLHIHPKVLPSTTSVLTVAPTGAPDCSAGLA